ncbi:MAG: glycosyltransferase [bacterium]|nr:glycosyltransferase [bacterium]
MIHVIFLSPHSDPEASLGEPDSGGQCIYEHELAQSLSAFPDFKITTYCRQTFRRPDISTINNSYSIKRIKCGPTGIISKETIEGVLSEFSSKVRTDLQESLVSDTIILHGHYWDGGFASLHIKCNSSLKLPFVWTPHSLGSLKRRRFAGDDNELAYNFIPRQCWESYSLVAADTIICSSEKEKQSLIEDYAVNDQKVEVISPGVRIEEFQRLDQQSARAALTLPSEGKILLCLGRMTKSKGYQRAIQAFAELKKIYQHPLHLVIVGGSAKEQTAEEKQYLECLHEVVAQYELQKSVHFRSALPHDKVATAYSAADIFLMSSEHEPFGLVTVEAMAMKLPVVAANKGGTLDILTHNRTGILVDFQQPAAVARYILSLLRDETILTQIGDNAYRHAKHSFDWYQKSLRFSQVYRKITRHQDHDNFQQMVSDTYFLQQHFKG